VSDMNEDQVYDQLEALIRSGRLRANGFDDGQDDRGAHLAALAASDLPLPADQIVLVAFTAIEQLAGWQASVEDLDFGSRGDLSNARESLGEIELLVEWARRVLDERLAELDAVRLADGAEDQS